MDEYGPEADGKVACIHSVFGVVFLDLVQVLMIVVNLCCSKGVFYSGDVAYQDDCAESSVVCIG